MTPKLSNLDIPEIKSAAAGWAFVSSQIEKITLHRFKPSKLPGPEGPFYAIIIWVSPEVDVSIAPWMELSERRVGEEMLPTEQVREQDRDQDGKLDRELARKHPLSGLWNLFWGLSAKESKERECLYSFYRDGFERSDPRFDWLVLLLNIGNEYVFDPGGIYDDLDNTETGSTLLFSRNPEARPEEKYLLITKDKSKRWYNGQDLVREWGIKGFESFDLMKKSLQAYTSTGKKVVDSDSLPRGKRQSLAQVEANQRAKQNARVIGGPGGFEGGPWSEDDIKRSAQRIYNNQSLEILNPPKDCVLMSFTLPNNDDDANAAIEKALGFQFRSVDVVKFADEYNQNHSSPPEETETEPTDPSALSHIDRVNIAGEPQQMQVLPERESTQYATAENPLPQNHNDKPLFSTQVWQEAVHLYEILLQTGFDGSDVDKKLQSAAKKELQQNREYYKYIKQKHLNKTDLFALNPGQERRDFIGKLLQRIAGKGDKKNYIGAQRLYEFGKKNYQNHN